MSMEEFKFPDEQETVSTEPVTDDLKIEVVDDTPPQDRGRQPLPKEIVNELENDDLEEYSEKVKRRLGQMKKVWHDERREKERAAREREEALAFAQRAMEENKQLKQRLGTGERLYKEEMTKVAASEIATAKDALKRAYESGDADRITDAQEALTDAKLKLRTHQEFKPSLQETDSGVQPTQQTQVAVPSPDPKAKQWQDKNTWFGSNKAMTGFAFGLHEELVESGVDPRSDDYYNRIDATMKKHFPAYFDEDVSIQPEKKEETQPSRKPPVVVAPSTRSAAPRQIRLNASQVAIAKKLGISPEQYARELVKLGNNNG